MTFAGKRNTLLLLSVTPILLIIELLLGFYAYKNSEQTNDIEHRNTQLDTYLRNTSRYVSFAESAQRGYLLTGQARYSDSFYAARQELLKNEAYYDTLSIDLARDSIIALQGLAERRMGRLQAGIDLYDHQQKDSALAMVASATGSMMMDSLRTASAKLRTDLNTEIQQHKERGHYLFTFFLGLIVMLIFFNTILAWYTERTLSQYTRNLEKAVDSLSRVNERMAQYTNLSYHELKTPLRNIAGFAQLLKKKYQGHTAHTDDLEFLSYIIDGVKQMENTIRELRSRYLDS
ncbi:MAG: CHASE3 domain-containing protein [Bacteroidetes bacterium]|nr:CHASE3 domain-containing protein [Bacteroidota bacterium]